MKVLVVVQQNQRDMQMELNQFIEDKKVIDIKYQLVVNEKSYYQVTFSALVMYEDIPVPPNP